MRLPETKTDASVRNRAVYHDFERQPGRARNPIGPEGNGTAEPGSICLRLAARLRPPIYVTAVLSVIHVRQR